MNEIKKSIEDLQKLKSRSDQASIKIQEAFFKNKEIDPIALKELEESSTRYLEESAKLEKAYKAYKQKAEFEGMIKKTVVSLLELKSQINEVSSSINANLATIDNIDYALFDKQLNTQIELTTLFLEGSAKLSEANKILKALSNQETILNPREEGTSPPLSFSFFNQDNPNWEFNQNNANGQQNDDRDPSSEGSIGKFFV